MSESRIKVDKFVQETKKVFSNQLWEMNLDNLSKAKKRIVKIIKLIRITFDTFAERRMGFQCVALSYFGALATIPLVALVFSVTGGLGISDRLDAMLYKLVPTDPTVINTLLEKAGNILDTARSGGVGLASALLFLWTIIWMMFQVERVFNNVWGIRKVPRKIYKRFSFYLLIIVLLPFMVILFSAGIALYSNMTDFIGLNFKEFTAFHKVLGWVVIYIVTTLTLSLMYKFIPAVKVKYFHALNAAAVAAVIFTLFQYLYLMTQVFVSRLNSVYGVIAAIPLFLIWMNFSWQIIIYGAQFSYGLQNVDSYNIPEGKLKDFTPYIDRIKKEREEEKLG